MPALDRSYISNAEVQADGLVAFACSQDVREWPWLALSPQHPLVIQTQNFWCSVGSGQALQARDDDKWSALTWTKWQLGDRAAGIAKQGRYRALDESEDGRQMAFAIELFDAADRLIVSLEGKGVVFRNRDFESWRETAKHAAKNPALARIEYADPKPLGLSDREPPLIAAVQNIDGAIQTTALITRENGLMPGHPYFSGSGDHVNAPHLAEIARQTVSLLNAGRTPLITGAEMDMHRYIELGTPFDIRIEQQTSTSVTLVLSQLGKSCANIAMQWGNRDS